MKILMYSHGFGQKTTTFIYNEVRFLSIENHLKYVTHSYESPENFPHDDVEIIDYKPNGFLRRVQWALWKKDIIINAYNPYLKKRIGSIMQQYKPDVIHCHFAYESIDFIENYKGNLPIIIHFHGYGASQMLKHKSYINKINEILTKQNVWIIYVSNNMKDVMLAHGVGITPRNKKIHCGTDTSFFKRNEIKEENSDFSFLQISSFASKKGHQYTLEAFARFLSQRNDKARFKLLIGGSGSGMDKVKDMCIKLNIFNQVKFLGYLNREEAKMYLNYANVFVHHSITAENGDKEGIPTAIMEAMAMELPILSTYHAGIHELVEHGVNGLLCEEKQVDLYAEQMHEIVRWNKLKNNREKILEKFEYNRHNEMLLEYYNHAIKNNTRSN